MTGEDPYALLALASAFVLNAGLALVIGAIASLYWSGRCRSAWSFAIRTQSSRLLRAGTAVVFAASVADLWLRSANAAGVPLSEAGAAVSSMLAGSRYGRAWTFGVIALAAVAVLSSLRVERHGGRRLSLWGTTLCAGVFVYSRSVVSHAATNGDLSLDVVVDWSHLVLIELWVGMVFVASIVNLEPAHRTPDERLDVASWIRSLSWTATMALVGIVSSGAFNTWRATGGVLGGLPGSGYGTVLIVKLSFVAISVALGAHNRFRSLPVLLGELDGNGDGKNALKSFTTVIRLEALTLGAALVAAAVLSSTEPPQTSSAPLEAGGLPAPVTSAG